MISINRVANGNGPYTLLLHGLFGDLDNLARLGRALDDRYRVVRADLPAHGDSGSANELTIDVMAEAMLDVLADESSGNGNWRLIGHSLGGKVVMRMAADPRCPPLAAMIIADMAPRVYPPHHQSIIDTLLALDLDTIRSRRDADGLLAQHIDSPQVRAFLLKSLRRDESGTWRWALDLASIAGNYPSISASPRIEAPIDTPALFIRGGASNYVRDQDWTTIESLFPRAELATIDGAGHWLHAERPDEFARLCLDFLARADTDDG
ncbi:MAG: alpha/beta hydrolase [Gammaproteobacteria bacterium]|nr:MAG: alpha/beta hydrolase [Gammaproteobacteria bacterium]